MSEQIYKLTPNRDLQCYFFMPSAIAAMSQSSDSGFTVSGKWRQQFDWAVVEWNRDNTFEHPALRYLPDGDLSGLTLTYTEARSGCIPFESNLSPIVDWNDLRIWATPPGGIETLYQVFFIPPTGTPSSGITTTPIGSYTRASATMTLINAPGAGNRAGVAMLEQHYYYTQSDGDTLADIAAGIAANINEFGAADFSATSDGPSVKITLNAANWGAVPNPLLGENGNRLTVYGFAQGGTQVWAEPAIYFSGGQFPSAYKVTVDFGNLTGRDNSTLKFLRVPTNNIRKIRWTWTADLQPGNFSQTEFQVQISDWTVTGQNRVYSVAGPGSRRIEDSDPSVIYTPDWGSSSGNYSGSTIHLTQTPGDTCTINYQEANQHQLFLGTRIVSLGANISVAVDGETLAQPTTLALNGEDVLVRWPLGTFGAGAHTVTIQHEGPPPAPPIYYDLFFDFLEIAYPSTNLPDFDQNTLSLATDWDTYHSQSLPAERTAWLIQKLGFFGRVNHYTGALWFYEIYRPGTQYSSLTVTFFAPTEQNLQFSPTLTLTIAASTAITHLVLLDDTSATIAQAFAGIINAGTNLLWASANGNQLTLTARAMGPDGDKISIQCDSNDPAFGMQGGGATSGGIYGTPYNLETTSDDNIAILNQTLMTAADYWRTDLTASPSLNRAARDWHLAYYQALKGYGIDVVTSFSTELMNGDPDPATGIVQVYPDGTPAVLNTPSIQTNFSPICITYWTQNYLGMASLQSTAGLQPYLQFGEVQWWYFPRYFPPTPTGGMPFYDAYTQQQFQAKYGVPMQIIPSNTSDPSQYPNEMAFLPTLIGAYTAAIRGAVLNQFPTCRFEVLYPTDTNNTDLNRIVNYASSDWTPENLAALKTESFGFTGSNNLDLCTYSMSVSAAKGFTTSQRSHLIGIGSAYNAWGKEIDIAQSQALDSIVLFALDQYCLIGYPPPPFVTSTRTVRLG